jgi:hypothetical protein
VELWSAIAAAFSGGAVTVALFACYWATRSAFAAERSAKSAELSVIEARRQADAAEAGLKSSRAYLAFSSVKMVAERSDKEVRFIPSVFNSGQSPAHKVTAQVVVTVAKGWPLNEEILFKRVGWVVWGDIPSGIGTVDREIGVYPNQLVPSPGAAKPDFIAHHLERSSLTLSITADFKISYQDVFSDKHDYEANYTWLNLKAEELGTTLVLFPTGLKSA